MSKEGIICKATLDTFVRLGIVIIAFLGFAAYFFYDGSVGYRRQNEIICSFKAFADLGKFAASASEPAWQSRLRGQPLLAARHEGGEWFMPGNEGLRFPLPADCEAARSCPPEAQNLAAMAKSWSDCWLAYGKRMRFPAKPGEHPYDEEAILGQWIAGGAFSVAGLLLLALALRTSRRVLALQGDTVTAAGRQFKVSEIERIDLRQWGAGFKGVAYFTVAGKRIRIDGMTYGGFSKNKGEPAERFMQAVLGQYKGEIISYETIAKDSPDA